MQIMKILLLSVLFLGMLFAVNKPIKNELTIHSHSHTHIQGSQHSHEHSHVENIFSFVYHIKKEKVSHRVNTLKFIAYHLFIPEKIHPLIFRPPIV